MTFTVTQDNKDEVLKQFEFFTRTFCLCIASYGYKCVRPFWVNGELKLQICKGENRYLPSITFDDWTFYKTGKLKWELNMAAFGSLSGEELEKWFSAQKAGMDLLHRLESENLKELLPELIFED